MKKLLLFVVVVLFALQTNAIAKEIDENYYPDYDDDRYRAGTFWASLAFGGQFPLSTPTSSMGVISGLGAGINFLDVLGVELRGIYTAYSNTSSNLLAPTGLIPDDGIKGAEDIQKFDVIGYLMFQPAFKIKSNFFIIPYAGVGANFSVSLYSFSRVDPAFAYSSTFTSIGFAAKAGVRFRLNNMLLGGGVEYLMAMPSSAYSVDFSSLTYQIEIGFYL